MRSPTVLQLQQVVDNSNPLLLTTGNPDLIPSYTHTFVARYGQTAVDHSQSMFVLLSATLAEQYTGTSTLIPLRDTTLADGTTLARGIQLSSPVNLNGYWNIRSFFTYGFPLSLMSSTLNVNAGVTFARTPGIVDNLLNDANSYSLSGGFVIGSNVSEDIDFTVTYSGN